MIRSFSVKTGLELGSYFISCQSRKIYLFNFSIFRNRKCENRFIYKVMVYTTRVGPLIFLIQNFRVDHYVYGSPLFFIMIKLSVIFNVRKIIFILKILISSALNPYTVVFWTRHRWSTCADGLKCITGKPQLNHMKTVV